MARTIYVTCITIEDVLKPIDIIAEMLNLAESLNMGDREHPCTVDTLIAHGTIKKLEYPNEDYIIFARYEDDSKPVGNVKAMVQHEVHRLLRDGEAVDIYQTAHITGHTLDIMWTACSTAVESIGYEG